MEDSAHKLQLDQAVLNAEVRKDIGFIKDTMLEMKNNLAEWSRTFVPRNELMDWKNEADVFHKDINNRVRFLERYAWAAIGALGVFQVALEAYRSLHR